MVSCGCMLCLVGGMLLCHRSSFLVVVWCRGVLCDVMRECDEGVLCVAILRVVLFIKYFCDVYLIVVCFWFSYSVVLFRGMRCGCVSAAWCIVYVVF